MADNQDWAPEPWKIGGDSIRDNDNRLIYHGGWEWESVGLDKHDINRIVACVNACAGIPTDVLENPNFKQMCAIVCEIAEIGRQAREASDEQG